MVSGLLCTEKGLTQGRSDDNIRMNNRRKTAKATVNRLGATFLGVFIRRAPTRHKIRNPPAGVGVATAIVCPIWLLGVCHAASFFPESTAAVGEKDAYIGTPFDTVCVVDWR